MKTRTKMLLLAACWIASEAMVIYPYAAMVYNSYVESLKVAEYETSVSTIDQALYAEMIEAAEAWNQALYDLSAGLDDSGSVLDDACYESLLNIRGDGMMGYVVIPEISVSLPIYHDVTDEILEKGAGHMETSSLPVGGENTHCVITAHRGLPTAAMFTDLDQLDLGDLFYLKVLNEVLTYEVTDIRVVEPEETETLLPEEGLDLCTLVTCTPYGINTHRLLVTGTRVVTEETDSDSAGEIDGKDGMAAGSRCLILVAVLEAVACAGAMLLLARKRGA